MHLNELCHGERNGDVVTISPNAALQSAAETMERFDVGSLVVVDLTDGKQVPVGILTDRDIVIRAVAKGMSLEETRVDSVMTKDLVKVRGDRDLWEAVKAMQTHAVRRVLVVGDDESLCGLVSSDDIVRVVGREMSDLGNLILAQVGTSERRRGHDFTRMA